MADELYSQYDQHNHNGLNSPRINPKDLLGFTIVESEAKLEREEPEGKMYIRWKTSDNTYYLTFRVNKTWVETQLT